MTDGTGDYRSLSIVRTEWDALLPKMRGALLIAVGGGLAALQAAGGLTNLKAPRRMVEYFWIGEYIARQMGFPEGQFQAEFNEIMATGDALAESQSDLAPIILSYLEGKRPGGNLPFGDNDQTISVDDFKERVIGATAFFTAIKKLAEETGMDIRKQYWASSAKGFSCGVAEVEKILLNAGWALVKKKTKRGMEYHYWRIKKVNVF